MAAICFFDIVEVKDPEAIERYREGVLATVEHYGGRYRVVGGQCDVVEGSWRPTFPVLLEFPSLADAHRWYDSVEYRELKALRLGATTGNAVFLESPPDEFVKS
jgi:uncharacterized protein (DUF1330 family)